MDLFGISVSDNPSQSRQSGLWRMTYDKSVFLPTVSLQLHNKCALMQNDDHCCFRPSPEITGCQQALLVYSAVQFLSVPAVFSCKVPKLSLTFVIRKLNLAHYSHSPSSIYTKLRSGVSICSHASLRVCCPHVSSERT